MIILPIKTITLNPNLTFYEKIYINIAALIAKTSNLPVYKENVLQQAEDYEEVLKALYGEENRNIRQLESGIKIFSLALPVQSYRKISGAILLTVNSENVETKLQNFRFEVFKVFFLIFSQYTPTSHKFPKKQRKII